MTTPIPAIEQYPPPKRHLNQEEFQQYVSDFLCHQFPDQIFKKGEAPDVIHREDVQFSLQNLYRVYALSSPEKSHKEIITHFRKLLPAMLSAEHDAISLWEEAAPLLRPQLMPRDFNNNSNLVSTPFHDNIEIGYVVDLQNGYFYLTKDHLKDWKKTQEEIHNLSMQNLDHITQGVQFHILQNAPIIMLEVPDSYTAARILLPAFRKKFADTLGEPFWVGIPHRDFLICWGKEASEVIQQRLRTQIQKDFAEESHPLTPAILRASVERIHTDE